MDNLAMATEKGLVKACHDLSDGGLGVAVAEMAFAGDLGASINLKQVPLEEDIKRDDYILFSESNSRFLAEVAPEDRGKFEKAMGKSIFAQIGEVTSSDMLEIYGLEGNKVLDIPINRLKKAWQRPLGW
jgi:phosphoribosylformylglycinamidine (FGAM) synthase-like enzyme